MTSAGSALMGIGRASGENRAVQAAQQAIESPLLEVSIDGARGILFNVIGGNDLSMHEINTAAETITNAADPDANIIFGATINPELDGEIIITVVATGFDASYFAERSASAAAGPAPAPVATPAPAIHTTKADDDMAKIDMSLDEGPATDFKTDSPMPNIWTLDDDDKDKEKEQESSKHDPLGHAKADSEDADSDAELEKPSFLRRLTKRHKESDTDKPA
jgi:cell division protein FtsZ